jgi:hypothetical protein
MAPIVIMGAMAAISAIGAISAGKAQSASYKSQQSAANYNATVNRDNAMSAEAAGSANELAMRRQNDQILGKERASAIEGTGSTSGTTAGVLAQNGADLELNALNERYRSTMQGRGLLAAGQLDEFQANVAGQNASAARSASYIGAASSALSSFSNYSSYRYLTAGGTSSNAFAGSSAGGWGG